MSSLSMTPPETTQYAPGELETHSCPVCMDVMESPTKEPIVLTPCGHTFCRPCLTQHQSHARATCPLCRTVIQSQGINFSLQHLITAKLRSLHAQATSTDPQILTLHYHHQYTTLAIRIRALTQRMSQMSHDIALKKETMSAKELVLNHLRGEEKNVQDHITHLQSQLTAAQQRLNIIQQHTIKHQEEMESLNSGCDVIDAEKKQLEATLAPMRRDRDKARLLLRSLAPHLQLPPD